MIRRSKLLGHAHIVSKLVPGVFAFKHEALEPVTNETTECDSPLIAQDLVIVPAYDLVIAHMVDDAGGREVTDVAIGKLLDPILAAGRSGGSDELGRRSPVPLLDWNAAL